MSDTQMVAKLHANGIVNPWDTLHAARDARMHLSVACANLELESSCGHNVFGHDPTTSIPNRWKGTPVTFPKYLYYRARRSRYGAQGVGPCQLTSPSLQSAADRAGGCWRPRPNMTVGFRFLQALIEQYGSTQLGFQHYNGSGPAAQAYGQRAKVLVDKWHRLLS